MRQPADVRVLRGDVIHGPFTREQVRELLAKGRITDADMVSVQNGSWVRVADYLGMHSALPVDYRPTPQPPPLPALDEPASVTVPVRRNLPDWSALLLWSYRGCLAVALLGVVSPWYTATSTVSAPLLGVGASRASVTGLSVVWGLLSLLAIVAGVVSSFLVRKWQVHSSLAGAAFGLAGLAAVQLSAAGPFGFNTHSSFGGATATAKVGVDWGLWLTLLSSGVAAAVGYAAGSPNARNKLGLGRVAIGRHKEPVSIAACVLALLTLVVVVWSSTNPLWSTKVGDESTSFFGGFAERGGASSPVMNMTVDEFRLAVSKHGGGSDVPGYGTFKPKQKFYDIFGKPTQTMTVGGGDVWLIYQCKDGVARAVVIEVYFERDQIFVTKVEQQS